MVGGERRRGFLWQNCCDSLLPFWEARNKVAALPAEIFHAFVQIQKVKGMIIVLFFNDRAAPGLVSEV